MKITLNTFGTRGDIQPTIALGLGLQRAGHDLRIVTHRIFEDLEEVGEALEQISQFI